MQLCAICNVNPATLHTPCECQVLTCEDCVPEHIPTQEELAEEGYERCTEGCCAYQAYAEDARFETVMEMVAEPVPQLHRKHYQNNAPWSALPDCHCVPVSACQCDKPDAR